jgi:F0F1-type ATP synthase membrane subunit c/vacuolar-type H+-ATPase subunit K
MNSLLIILYLKGLTMAAQFVGAGLATIAMAGAGVGIGSIFAGLILGIARQPS